MNPLHSELFSWLACRFRGRVELELEVIALRHQLAVLRRQRPGRARLCSVDRLVWRLYRVWPRFLNVVVVVKPATVVQWLTPMLRVEHDSLGRTRVMVQDADGRLRLDASGAPLSPVACAGRCD
jgi:hypothetical protein